MHGLNTLTLCGSHQTPSIQNEYIWQENNSDNFWHVTMQYFLRLPILEKRKETRKEKRGEMWFLPLLLKLPPFLNQNFSTIHFIFCCYWWPIVDRQHRQGVIGIYPISILPSLVVPFLPMRKSPSISSAIADRLKSHHCQLLPWQRKTIKGNN